MAPKDAPTVLRLGVRKRGSAACGVSFDDVEYYRVRDSGPPPSRRDIGTADVRLGPAVITPLEQGTGLTIESFIY